MSSIGAVLLFLLIIALSILVFWYNSPKQKGKRGELFVSKILSQLSSEYTNYNDLIFQTDKSTTQIDHLVLSKYGVFVIETKNYGGEIYGDDERKEWTQIYVNEVRYRRNWYKTYTYVTKNHFYNPVKQAYGHVYKIKELLKDYPHLPVIPIVVFVGTADISNVSCRNHVIYEEDLCSLISSYRSIYLNENDLLRIQSILQNNNVRQVVSDKTHILNLQKAKQEVESLIQSGICPKCGGQLIKRSGKFGTFYGCSNYPKCKFTIS